MQRKTIGILGGGQLGRMLIQAGINYPLDFHIYSDHSNFTSKNLCQNYTIGDLNDYHKIIKFGTQCDIITIEIENINIPALFYLRDHLKKEVYPPPEALEIIKDRSKQKQFLKELEAKYSQVIQTMDYTLNYDPLTIKYPLVNKLIKGGYDGYGTKILQSPNDLPFNEPSIFEEYCQFDKELSITIARTKDVSTLVYPPVEMVFNQQNMLKYLICPIQNIDPILIKKMELLAQLIATKLNFIGILSIEMFLKGDEIYINELAPRPHNSAHHTQDMFSYSQFDALMRALLNYPYGLLRYISPMGATINILNFNQSSGQTLYSQLKEFHQNDIYLHLYDKPYTKPYRKMGHINILADSYQDLMSKISTLEPIVEKCISTISDTINHQNMEPLVGIIMGSYSDYQIMSQAAEILKQYNVPYEIKIVSAHRTPELMINYGKSAYQRGLKVIIAGAGGAAHLAGMVASTTILPVIGVPIKSSNSIDGWDSILSMLQMPQGTPVATVALNQAHNGGILAMRILGMTEEMSQYRQSLEDKVYEMQKKIEEEKQ